VLQAGERVGVAAVGILATVGATAGHKNANKPDKPSSTYSLLLVLPLLHIAYLPLFSRAGAIVLEAGERVGVAEVGILATVGAATLPVHRRPRLAVLSTGDEVVSPETQALGPGQIRDCNRAMLLAAAAGAGAEVTDLGIARWVEEGKDACRTGVG
jgi:hypothetical protein